MKNSLLPWNSNLADSLYVFVFPHPFPADDKFRVLDADIIFGYENGQKTSEIKGVSYVLVSEKMFSCFTLKVPGTSKLLVSREDIEQAAEEGEAIYFELNPAKVIARPYKYDAESRKYLLSIQCEESAITVV